ncbi:MAG: PEP/pyruvate-binding domain-containing protein [Anaerolineales bacterium]
MAFDPDGFPKVLTLLLELHEYPILAPHIRERMREEMFKRGVITREAFEAEVHEKSIQSQERERLRGPDRGESPDVWMNRLRITRDNLTDFYFAYNLPHELFESIVRQTLVDRGEASDVVLTFHPELAPWDMLFAQGEAYESLPPDERSRVKHHLQEITVVLIKAMISDHLEYVGIAREWLSIADLKAIRKRRIGRGKIGGKAAGIELARAILTQSADAEVLSRVHYPKSWFLAADVFYRFNQFNDLFDYANQKYKSESEIRDEYPTIRQSYEQGRFPEEFVDPLREILEELGSTPLIVRSSSLLEDSFGFSFAGKYESIFCGNQGTLKENLRDLLRAVADVYSGVYNPDVLLYRKSKGLVDYDERMAVLIQEVRGRKMNGYLLPDASGVAFSQNQYRWSPKIDREAGFLRLVWGLGTRAVEQVGNDYPRLVALSHPELRPDRDPDRIRRYSQHFVDLIDFESNAMETVPISDVLDGRTPQLRWIGQRYRGGVLQDFITAPLSLQPAETVITFSGLLRHSNFARDLKHILETLEAAYRRAVDIEFLTLLGDPPQDQNLYLLQCRPQSQLELENVELPTNVPEDRLLFASRRLVPDGRVSGIRYVVYISPEGYGGNIRDSERASLARLVGRINARLADESFVLIGPSRWGTQNPRLGIPVGYGDIYHAKALIELVADDQAPEPSYGTHFFQDLVETGIYPLAVALENEDDEFNKEFFESSENVLPVLLPQDADWEALVRVIELPDDMRAELVMNGKANEAIAYLVARES